MGIKGKITAKLYADRVEAMNVGQTAYISAGDLTITRKAIFLDIINEIITEKEFDETADENFEYVSIKRVGDGLSEYDFEIDLTILKDYEYYVDDNSTFNACMKASAQYIVFQNFELEIVKNISEPETLESLKLQLKAAEDAQHYEIAEEIKNKIEKLKKKKG